MNKAQYIRSRQERLASERPIRQRCLQCRKSISTCYCAQLRPFDSKPQFLILIHHDEVKRSIATGRMAHQCLSNSYFFEGTDFSNHAELNKVLSNPLNYCVVLYPGINSTEITRANGPKFHAGIPKGKRLVVIVIDATWGHAKRVKRLSVNLHALPFICFTPETPSRFLVRQQPEEHCYSTIEAIHTMIDWMNPDPNERHQSLLEVFSYMVNQQIEFEMHYGAMRGFKPTRGARERDISL